MNGATPGSGPGAGPAGAGAAQPMAVVGMAGRFPGAGDIDALWSMLLAGTEAVRRFSSAELRAAGVPDERLADPRYLPYGADLAGIEDFDAALFGITPAEARVIDPQHRIFLECVWTALQDAGTPSGVYGARTGVFGSASLSSYLLHHVLRAPEFRDQAFTYPVLLGNDKDFLATRVSYALDLRGPSVTVQSACSSSLVAVDEACTALRSGRCDLAVAGGVSVYTPQTVGYRYQDGGTYARDGHCRPFDAAASGMVRGSGCGVVVLKRLADALADRDNIYALVAGTAVNNDGAAKAGYSAPSAVGQDEVIRTCLAASGVPASAIGYVEAHGTGTYLGDPIEVAALRGAYEGTGDPPRSCALGSVKANIGHLDAAAGVTGLIKAVLVLHHQTVPPQANFTEPNPELRLEDGPFTVSDRTVRPETPLRAAAATSLGIGGTNAHCVLERAPTPAVRAGVGAGNRYRLPLSAPDGERLRGAASDLLDHLERHPRTRLDDLAYTLSRGRPALARRTAVTASTVGEAVQRLREVREGRAAGARGEELRAEEPGPEAPGAEVAGPELRPELREARKIRLPVLRLRRERHWIELESTPGAASATAGERASPGQSAGGPASDPVEAVAEVFRSHLGVGSVRADDDYFALGGDSLQSVGIAEALSHALDVPLSAGRFTGLRTPRRVAEWCESIRTSDGPPGTRTGTGTGTGSATGTGKAGMPGGAGTARGSGGETDTLVLVKEGAPGGGDLPVFLIHPSGGTVSFAFALAAHSSYAGPVYAIGYPAALSATLTTVEGMARHYLRLIRGVRPHGPYRIGGYSLGGTVALEAARQLTGEGERVERVLLFDTLPPREHQPALGERAFLAAFPGLLRLTFGLPEPGPGTGRHQVTADPRTVDEAIASVRAPGWTEATVRELHTMYEAWRTADHAIATHRPGTYEGPVELFAAEQPLPEQALSALGAADTDGGPGAGTGPRPAGPESWRSSLTGELRVTRVPGHHFSMFDSAHLPALAAAYDSALARTPSGAEHTAPPGPSPGPSRGPSPGPSPGSGPGPSRGSGLGGGPGAGPDGGSGGEPLALLFPGQGTQHAGMGRELIACYPESVAEADEALGFSVAAVCAGEDPQRPLSDTAFAQPALCLVGALAYRRHLEETGERPAVALGHSVGEYNALEAAGVFTLTDCLRLVAGRGAAMARIGGGGMIAVGGLTEEAVREILNGPADGPGPGPGQGPAPDEARAHAQAFPGVDLAAVNAPSHLTLAGSSQDLAALTPVLLAQGARSVRGLNVSGPFHSRLMSPAADEFRTVLRESAPRPAPFAFPVIANTTAQPHEPGTLLDELVAQIDHPVRWQRSVERAIADHAPRFKELGGRRTLTPMVARIRGAL